MESGLRGVCWSVLGSGNEDLLEELRRGELLCA